MDEEYSRNMFAAVAPSGAAWPIAGGTSNTTHARLTEVVCPCRKTISSSCSSIRRPMDGRSSRGFRMHWPESTWRR